MHPPNPAACGERLRLAIGGGMTTESTTPTSESEQDALLWPVRADGPHALADIERMPLEARNLPASTYALLTRAAERWPDLPAASCLPDANRWEQPSRRTFAELALDVHRYAQALYALAVRRHDPVTILSMNCEQMNTVLLAAEAVGIAAPINPGLSPEHAAGLLQLSGGRVIVAAGPELDSVGWRQARALAAQVGARTLLALRPTSARGPAPALEPISGTTVSYLEVIAAEFDGDHLPGPMPQSSDIASYLHTGGTTGIPKLAAHTHANQVVSAWMVTAVDMLEPHSVLFGGLPLFHVNALVTSLIAPLLKGHHVVWAGPLGYRDPSLYEIFWKLVERYRITTMSGVPTVYARLAQVPVDADISTLRMPIVGAAPLPPAVASAFHATTGLDLCEGYGLTEATCASARNWPGYVRRGSVGQRLPYQQVRAVELDPRTEAPTLLPAGQRGMIAIKGPIVFPGYVVRDGGSIRLDAGDKMHDDWLETGDLGSVDEDGYITLIGRAKDLIIRGGHNIDPAVIEDALLAHPAVTAAAAVGRPDVHAGEVPVAFVTLAPGARTAGQELLDWAAGKVAERAAAPKAVTVVDEIPTTAVGKPYKPELRRRATESAARGALSGRYEVRAVLEDGIVVVLVSGGSAEEVTIALNGFSFPWRLAVIDP